MSIARNPAQLREFHARGNLAARYRRVRAASLALCAPLSAEDMCVQSTPDASPVKWHLAHTTWFFETFILKAFSDGYAPFDEAYHYLFNSYYEAEGPRHARAKRGLLTRPSIEDVRAWRAHVDDAIEALLADELIEQRAGALFELGFAHEEQHQELILMDLKHLFSENPLAPSYGAFPPDLVREARPLEWLSFEGGLVEIGDAGDAFAFDNERPRHRTFVQPFRLASRPATNAEFLEFIEDGGYERAEFWLADGWAKAHEEGWRAPLYWRGEGDERGIFTLAGLQPINPAAPVCHVSYFEADAFARWAGKRLPTEAEWEVAAGDAALKGHFADARYYHPKPAPGPGLVQLYGDVWEWTQSPYTPYPGFRPAAGAVGEYNGKFMCGQFVLKGGSAATPPGHLRPTYRNFFPPAARWAFSGIRLADDA